MKLFDKTLDLAKKATSAVADTAAKKIAEAKQKREEEERRFIEEFPYKYRYVMRQKESISYDIDPLLLWDVLERDSYLISNANEEPAFIAKGTLMFGKHHFVVTNSNKEVIGKVNKALFKIPVPLAKDRKSFLVDIPGEENFTVSTYTLFDEADYSISLNNITMKADKREKEFMFLEKGNPKPIIHVYKVRSDDLFLRDKYFVGFDNENYLVKAVLLTLGIDVIFYGAD